MQEYDNQFMSRAIMLAKRGKFTTSPNPNVGCVIVKNQKIVGEGFHKKSGGPHAEIYALKMAGEKAKGATVYITLEPCNFYGKTPPCINALINSGITRAVISSKDPNPKVSGNSIAKLKQSGIQVTYGLLHKKSTNLNKGFFKRMKTGLPYVQIKLAASLDGKVALRSGESKWISSSSSRQDVQIFRAQSSAILSTSKTILSDNPSLNVRWNDFPKKLKNLYQKDKIRQPIRIILDNKNQITSKHKVTKINGECWLIRNTPKIQNWVGSVKQIISPVYKKKTNLILMMKKLAKYHINSIFVESGPKFSSTLLQLGLVDELIIYLAPKILGKNAIGLIETRELKKLKNAPLFKFIDSKFIDPDLRIILHPKTFSLPNLIKK